MTEGQPKPFNLFQEATDLLRRHQDFSRTQEIGEHEQTHRLKLDYPTLPVMIWLATDIHYGSQNTNYDLLQEHLQILEDTPNTYMIENGDGVDNFNALFFQAGMMENPLKPQLQTLAFLDKIKALDKKGKLAGMTFGNHNEFMEDSGYEWDQTFLRDIKAPIFPSGGLLHLKVGKQTYDIAMTHRYWGYSKLNPTNAPKRYLEHEYPEADIVFLGHFHQSEILHFDRAGKDRIAVLGGTYKQKDEWARKRGIGGRGGEPGYAVLLDPVNRHMTGFKDIKDAQHHMLANIWMHEFKQQSNIEDFTVFDREHIDYVANMRGKVDKTIQKV